jgi:hypothetical protein
MPDTKITALTALTAADPANDMMPIVDVSDTSMAASGTTKRISINNILACSPSATLASATITGDLTVAANTLKVDSTNNRVGIGTASPGTALQIASVSPTIRIQDTSTSVVGGVYGTIDWLSSDSSMTGLAAKIDTFDDGATYGDRAAMRFFTNNGAANTEKYRIASDGVSTWSVGGSTAMTLNSTGLGVGVAPAVRIDLLVADAAEATRFRAASGWLRIHPYLNATDNCRLQAVNGTNTALIPISVEGLTVRLNSNFGNAVTIDSLGNTISNVNSAIPSLGTNSQMVFNLTSNTNLRISVRGTDGTTRVANITLA